MKPHKAPIADISHSMPAVPGRARQGRVVPGPSRAVSRPLFVVFVALAVLASSIVFANTTSAHDVAPVKGCEQGDALDGDTCTETTTSTVDAAVSCPDGFDLSGTQCSKTTTTSVDAAVSCPDGFTLSGTQCTRRATQTRSVTYTCDFGTLSGTRCLLPGASSITANASCPSGYTLGGVFQSKICYRYVNQTVPATASCPAGYTLGQNRCTKTAEETRSPTYTCGLGTLSGTKCLISSTETRSPTYTCGLGTLSGTKCLISSTETRSPTYTCGLGTLSGTKCLITKTRTYDADTTCTTGTWDGTACAHSHPTTAPTVTGLNASGASVAGTDYSDDFTVTPADTAVSVTGQGCSLAGEAGSYTLTASRAGAGTRTCTITAGTATATTTVTFAAARTHFHAPAQPPNLWCATVSSTSVVWRWDPAERAEGYEVRIYDFGINTDRSWKAAGDMNQRSHTTSGWTPSANPANNRRSLDVRAVNDIGAGKPSYGRCQSLPAGWLTAACDAHGEITATWSVPEDLKSTPGVAYAATIAERRPHGYGGTTLAPYSGTATTLTRTGTPGTTYAVAVRTQPIEGKPVYTETKAVECEITVPVRVEADCRADGDVRVSWAGPDDAQQYRLTIGISGASTTARTVTEYVPDTAQANPPTTHVRPGAVGARYNITVAANDGTAWTSESEPAAATCDPIAPPAPTGVTASCSSGTLTVAWDTAGEGLSAATAYQPRIFIGASTNPDLRWTANAPGSATSATIPGPGDNDLPETGVFQVRVKAANTAGDSDWSDPVAATCGPPGPITDLKCTTITKDQITIEWNKAVGAQNYTLIIAPTPTGTSQPPSSVAALQQKKQSYTFEGLTSGHLHRIAVQPTNTKLGTIATLECTTVDHDWLKAECSGSGIISVRWDDPSGSQTAPSGYTGTITLVSELLDGLVASYDEAYDSNNTTVEWGAFGASESEYQVYVKSKGVNGGPDYSQTKTATCPALSSPDYNGPNVPENLSWWQKLLVYLGAADGSPPSHAAATLLYFEGADYALNRVSRSCNTVIDKTTGITTQTCDEVWNEHITVRLDESSFDETLATVQNAIVPDDEAELLAALVGGTFSLRLLWKKVKKEGAKKVATKIVSRTGVGVLLETYIIWVYYDGTAPYAQINGQDNCVFDQPKNRGNDIKNWTAVEVSISATETAGKIKSVRNAVVHYCKETE